MRRLSTINSVSCTTFTSQQTETSQLLVNSERQLKQQVQTFYKNDIIEQPTNSNLKIRRSKDSKSGLDRFELRFVCYEKELPDDEKDLLTSELRAVQLTMVSLVSALEAHLGRLTVDDTKALDKC